MTQLTVQGTGVTDTYIESPATTHNAGSEAFLGTGKDDGFDNQIRRALIKFDISSIPAGSTIIDATITLTAEIDRSSNNRALHVYRVKRAWTDSGATWATYDGTNTWASAGCADTTSDREATDLTSTTQAADYTAGQTQAIPLTASKIQEMVTGGSFTNNGFLLQVDAESTDQILWDSTEATTSTNRPKLVITYTLPGGIIGTEI